MDEISRSEAITKEITEILMTYNKDLCSRSAINLLKLTLAVESDCMLYNRQKGGVALSAYQIEPATYIFVYDYLAKKYGKAKLGERDFYRLLYDFKHATIIARGKYLSIPKKLPDFNDINGLAWYWKIYFNTQFGKGTVKKAVKKYNKYFK